MGFNRKALGGTAKGFAVIALSLILALTTFTVAFADFIPVPKTKVLGVGRIQSTLPEVPVTSESKFVLSSTDNQTDQAVELVAPIAREVAPVIVPQLPEPTPNNSGGSFSQPASGSGWITTMATNYATSEPGDFGGDQFLNCTTANGDVTTTTSMGVAHKNLKLGTVIEIYCPRTGLSCIAVVNDRGPYGGYWGTQPDTFDLQMAVTAALGNNYGWYEVQYRVL